MQYTVHFVFQSQPRERTTERALANIKDGFWVDANLNLTYGSDAVYWIPPSKIEYIEKINNG